MKIDELMTIATFDTAVDAERLRTRFDEAGIGAEVLDERAEQRFLLFSRPHSGIKVRVTKDQKEQAERLMREWDRAEGILTDAVSCPECGSYAIEYPQFSRKTYQSVFFAVLSALGFMRRLYYCKECQFTWSPVPEVKRELDVLNWPVRKPKAKKA